MDIRRRMSFKKKASSSGESTTGGSYTVNLNSQWEATTAVPNPDSTLYDGVYRSSSNYNVNNGVAIMYITIKDCSSFKMYIRSYAESNYDYVMVSQLDQTITGITSYSNTTLVKAHTRGNQQSGTALSNYTLVEFTGITPGEHIITVVYRKDGSVNNGDDRGYVLIEKPKAGSGDSGGDDGSGGDDEGGSGEGSITDNYLTIEALDDGLTASLSINACEYCVDGDGNWKTLAAGTDTESINSGHTLSFRGNLTPVTNKGIGTFTIRKKCNLKGNCMSMLFGDNAANNYSLSGKGYAFYNLFYNGFRIVNVSDNFLPATTLVNHCYAYMFYDCKNLTTAPELPATELTDYCYRYMFSGCSSLTTAPILGATYLAPYCYADMFSGCIRLTTAPELPVTKLATHCYYEMFINCTSLTTAPELPATILAGGCYRNMFFGCDNLTTAPALPATTLANSCYSNMFYQCEKLTTAPELPATTLVSDCYGYMFSGCKKLNYIKMLATDISATECLEYWVNDVSSSGTFVKHPNMTTLPIGVSGIPSGWTVVDNQEHSGSGNEITFYINDGLNVIPMTALSNMTWEEFVNSEYVNQNSIFTNFRLYSMGSYDAIMFYHEESMSDMTLYNNLFYENARDFDVIEDGKTYYAN